MNVILVIQEFSNGSQKFDWYMYLTKMAAERTSGLERKKNMDIATNSLSKERMSSN